MSGSELGAPGYVMERIRGETPSAGMFARGLLADADPETRQDLLLEGVRYHGRLRKAAIGVHEVPHLLNRGEGSNCFEREIAWWHFEGRSNLANDSERLARLETARDWLFNQQPSVRPPTLAHGDSQYANLMYRDGKVVAGIDWELAFLGHGEIDLALMILMASIQSDGGSIKGIPSREEFIATFEESSESPVEAFDYFDAFSHFRLLCVLPASRASMPNFEDFWESVADSFWALTH